MTSKQTAVAAAAGLAVLCSTVIAAGPAQASHGGSDAVRAAGACSNGPGVWKLKGKADDGLIEVEFEVDTNQIGQTWHVRITDNRHLVVSKDATTIAPSGSFTVRAHPNNRPGVVDVIRAHAFRGDQVCGGKVRV
jgi:hypothetical protein